MPKRPCTLEKEEDGIEIMTDARHGWRKNAKDTSVVAIGEKRITSYDANM